jgi:hypothetical protein
MWSSNSKHLPASRTRWWYHAKLLLLSGPAQPLTQVDPVKGQMQFVVVIATHDIYQNRFFETSQS